MFEPAIGAAKFRTESAVDAAKGDVSERNVIIQACVCRRFARHDRHICVKLLGHESASTLSAVIC